MFNTWRKICVVGQSLSMTDWWNKFRKTLLLILISRHHLQMYQNASQCYNSTVHFFLTVIQINVYLLNYLREWPCRPAKYRWTRDETLEIQHQEAVSYRQTQNLTQERDAKTLSSVLKTYATVELGCCFNLQNIIARSYRNKCRYAGNPALRRIRL